MLARMLAFTTASMLMADPANGVVIEPPRMGMAPCRPVLLAMVRNCTDEPEGRPLSQLLKMAVLSVAEQSALILGGINLLVRAGGPSGVAAGALAAGRTEPATRTSPRSSGGSRCP